MQINFFYLPNNKDYYTAVSFEKSRTSEEIASLLWSADYQEKVRGCSAIVVRPTVYEQLEYPKKLQPEFQIIIDRFKNLPLYILYSKNFDILISDNLNDQADGFDIINDNQQEFINLFRQAELENFISLSTSIFKCPTNNSIFRTPSREYSYSFLRVGNIQTSRYVIDSIFFWTLPYLKNAGAILTDSWSISSLALNISRLLIRYTSTEPAVSNDIANYFHVNMLGGYYHGLREMDKETKDSITPLLYNNNKKILFIISAIKTNQSLKRIKRAINEKGFAGKVDYLAIYNLADTPEKYLCDLNDYAIKKGISFESFSLPPKNETVIPIDEKSFFPIETKDNLIQIKGAYAEMSKPFIETYGGKGIISLHRNIDPSKSSLFRHHGVFIDIIPLLSCNPFIDKLNRIIDSSLSRPPACIIHPPHDQAGLFANKVLEIIKNRFHKEVNVFCFETLEPTKIPNHKIIAEFLGGLTEKDNVLIIDDVSITGRRLHTYQDILHGKYRGKTLYLVAVARPESEEAWQIRKNILQFNGNKLLNVEKIYLPDWNEKNCPWCQERDKLSNLILRTDYSDLPYLDKFTERINELIQAELNSGLIDNVFFDFGKIKRSKFRGGSVFCSVPEISEADLVASVASTIQGIRNGIKDAKGKETKLSVNYPLFNIIDPDDYLKPHHRLFEPLVKACLIRTCLHRELYATEDKNIQTQKIHINNYFENKYDLSESDNSFFIYELLLAIKNKKLPKPNIDKHLRYVLNDYF